MKTLSTIIIILVIALVIGSAFAYRLIDVGNSSQTKSICQACFPNEPVGDIIIPQIATGSSGKSNLQLNVTRGGNVNLTVEVFLTINASVYMSFDVRLSPGTTSTSSFSPFAVSFSPERFEALENKNASTVMSISTSDMASKGVYSTEVVVTDSQNQSYTWGTQVEINVG